MGFLGGFLGGEFRRSRPTVQDLVDRENERSYSLQIRQQLQESQELSELSSFLERQPYSVIDKSRPENFDGFIGQQDVKSLVQISVEASKIKNSPLSHSLFYGEAGLGKTTLAYLVSKELNANLILTVGEQFRSEKEVFNAVSRFQENKVNILFIDEIHTIKIPETFYPMMTDFFFPYVTKSNKTENLPLLPFTLLGATTDPNKLPEAFRQRFQNRYHLLPYTVEDLTKIAENYLKRIDYYSISDSSIIEIAKRSRNVARYVIGYVKNLLDYCIVKNKTFDNKTVEEYFVLEGVDSDGITKADKMYLRILLNAKNFKTGLATIIKATGINRRIIEQDIEPYLIRQEMIEIIPGGRSLKDKGFDVITKDIKT